MKKYIFLLAILISSISCNTTKEHFDEHNYLSISDLIIKDKEFLSLLENSVMIFNDKYKKPSKIILVELLSSGNTNNELDFYITNELFLYTDQSDKMLLQENFIALGEIKNIPVLVKNVGGDYKNFGKYFEISTRKRHYKIEYGNVTSFCTQKFNVKNDKILLTDSYCSFDLIQNKNN